ncbi:Gfo/Idh/MocA family protein [Jatrophihabitans lederbergiae]|uniref:Gfo/Idh/MocA family oxidoreductase n=1 Tax=Jatrophihabitans lederbergiae TaxID=3075547 RepID=A0ABU2J6I0_9ACTN|nr:Gfo/Idh/MocA family oxidoreductase [Jatrophihabitans sp. DSM 44399]MDT0260592.1 Gfo/Idh/MocA family oxidoreductase [Jatrophihabitans sp. DSM 44399]
MSSRPFGVAVLGFGWMGHAHSRAYARVRQHFPDLGLTPRLVLVAEPDSGRGEDARERYGFADWTPDWRQVLADDRVEAVSVTAPNFLHREIAVAVAAAGKHLWIEKPVGLSAEDAQAVAEAVRRNRVQTSVGFNYRNAPAVAHARELIATGQLGKVTDAAFRLLSDYAAHPLGALSWRFERAQGGAGVLGDLVSHGVDLVRHLLGDIDTLVADTATFIAERPRPDGLASHFAVAESGVLGPVENEDYLSCLLRLRGGARASLRASRVAVGEQNNYGFEIHGTRGSVSWDFRRMGELAVCVGGNYANQPSSTLYVGPAHGDFGAFQPGAGVAMGYDDLKVIEAAGFLRAIAGSGVAPGGGGTSESRSSHATIEDAVQSALALEAMVRSQHTGQWEAVTDTPSIGRGTAGPA